MREPIEVRVEPDRIQILSYPGPDRSVTPEALQSYHVIGRRYRNRRIGDYLKELHLTEGRNTGFRKILRALENNGSPLPEFITDDDRSFFATLIHIHKMFDGNGSSNQVVSEKHPKKHPKKQPDISRRGLSEKLGLTKTEVRIVLDRLKRSGKIHHVGATNGGYWVVDDSQ